MLVQSAAGRPDHKEASKVEAGGGPGGGGPAEGVAGSEGSEVRSMESTTYGFRGTVRLSGWVAELVP